MNLTGWLKNAVTSTRGRTHPRLIRVRNATRDTLVASRVETAGQSGSRRKGLLGRTGLAPEEGLWIIPCEAVHTFGMKFSIDLIYLDRDKRVRKIKSNVPPWRVSACLSAHSVLEFASGTIQRTNTRLGDRLEFSSDDSIR